MAAGKALTRRQPEFCSGCIPSASGTCVALLRKALLSLGSDRPRGPLVSTLDPRCFTLVGTTGHLPIFTLGLILGTLCPISLTTMEL